MINCSFLKSYKNFNIKADLSINGIHGIIGASGVGKSTVLLCIAGLVKPDEGYININTEEVFNKNKSICEPPQNRKAALVMQSTALFNNMTAFNNISSCIKGDEKQFKAKALLKAFYAEDCADKMPYELSGGQAQRVAIARAIASNPQCLLLDEPFSALDLILKDTLTKQIFNVVQGLKIPVLYVSHDLNELLQVCTSFSVIENCRLSQAQSKSEFLLSPNTKMGKALLKRLRPKH